MYPYWIVASLMIFFSILDILLKSEGKKIIKKYLLILSASILIVFAGIRGDGTGKDDTMYKDSYEQIVENHHYLSLSETIPLYKYEPLTTTLMYWLSYLSSNPNFFLIVYAFFSVSLNTYAFSKFSSYPLIATAVYSAHLFISKDLNQIRFGLSSALFVLFLTFFFTDKKKSYFTIFLAIMAHLTSLAGLIMIGAKYLPQRKIIPILIVILSLPLGLIGGKVLFSHLFDYLPGAVSGYNNSDHDNGELGGGGIFSLANLKNICFLILFLFLWSKSKIRFSTYENNLFYFIILTYSIGIAVRIIFNDFSVVGGRVSLLFLHVEPLLIAMSISRANVNKLAILIFVVFITIYYYYHDTIQTTDYIYGYSVSKDIKIF